MKQFSLLLENLLLTPARNQKIEHLIHYFRTAPDPDRGYALAVLTGALSLQNVKPAFLRHLVLEKIDPELFSMSYDYVGDLAETIALIWPDHHGTSLPTLSGLILELESVQPDDLPEIVAGHLSSATLTERWAILKLATGNLRVGVSARLAKIALAQFGRKTPEEIERLWHGLQCPYEDLFAWLEDKGPQPEIHLHRIFHPMMLSNPVDEGKDFPVLNPADYQAEWKWDGIRVQLVLSAEDKLMYSRTGDNISHTFPDITQNLSGNAVLDGELMVGKDFTPSSFNALQQRLNRKAVNRKILEDYPAFIRLYDILFDDGEDLRSFPLSLRRQKLENWLKNNPSPKLDLSEIIPFSSWTELEKIRKHGADAEGHEGIMIKHKDSLYQAGRPKGPWFKWKRDPCNVDAILMYAQRGHGKRSSFYSDYTFGVWKGNEIVPIGKAYFGFTDDELKQIDRWVRHNTIERYGPVREVKKELVFEVSFDSAQKSARHRSGVALRFPRINRIRWDKPPQEAGRIEDIYELMT